MISKVRIVDTFDKRPEKKAPVLPTERGIYYAQKVGFGYGTEARALSHEQFNFDNADGHKRKIKSFKPQN